MIGVTVICVGKLKEQFFRAAFAEYQKRLSRYCSFTVKELSEVLISENPSTAQINSALLKEGESILKEIPKDSFVCALCIEGKQLSSEEFSQKIADVSQSGKSKICFIIGSSFGLSDSVKQAAHLKLSFSKMTFPHQMFRVILAEQIYRAFSILGRGKYHK